MMKPCPDSVDVTDLQFKLQCRLKIFENDDVSTFSNTNSLLTCASRYGLLFVGTKMKQFEVIQTEKVHMYTTKDKDVADYPRRKIDLPSSPKHLCVNCDNTIIAVVVEKDQCSVVIFFDVLSFLAQNIKIIKEIRLSSTPNVYVKEINWNPSLPAVFTACKSDGTLGVYELKGDSVDINELPAVSGASCFCWSPKGKQIAVGSKDGKITQYKPDLKAVKVINEPQLGDPHTLISLQWVSNYQFVGVYQSLKPEGPSSVIVVDAPRIGEPSYTNYDDICYSGSCRQPQFYLILQQDWNFLMVASANSSEVGVLGCSGDSWTQWIMSDTGRAELPLSQDHQETLPVGLTFDVSSTIPLPWGEASIPPCPLLCMLSHQGILCCFNVVYLKEGIPSLCTPADPIQDISGLDSFIRPGNKTSSTEGIQFKPNQPPPAQLNFGMGQIPQIANPSVSKDSPLLIPKVTVPFTAPIQSTPLVTGKVTTDISSLFGGQATITPIKPQQPSQGASLFGGQTLITPISKGVNASLANSSVSQATNVNSDKYASIFSSLNPTTLPPTSTVPVKPIVISAVATSKPEAAVKPPENPSSKVTEFTASKATSKQITTFKPETQMVDPKLKAETNAMLSQMIRDEWMYLEAELKVLLNQGRVIKISLGTDEEKVYMITQIESLQEFVKEAVDISVGQSSEIHCLKQNLIQSWAWFEEANSYYNSSKNEAVTLLLKLQPLDSVSQKRLKDIEQLAYYIESQLHQTGKTLDEQWGNFQDYAKKTYRMPMPTMEAIFQTMVRQSAILQRQTYILKDISLRLRKKTFGVSSLLLSVDKTENLADDLRKLSLDTRDILQLQFEKIKNHTKIISDKKANTLRALLKQRKITHITAVRPQLSSWTINQSPASRMRQSVSILGAQVSPVSKNDVAKSLSFIQSTSLKESDTPKPSQVTFSFGSSEKSSYSVTSKSSPITSGFVSLAKGAPGISNSQGSAFAPIGFTSTSSTASENQPNVSKTNLSTMPFSFASSSANISKPIQSVSQVKPSFSTPLYNSSSLVTSEQVVNLAGSSNSLFKSVSDTSTVKPQSVQSAVASPNFAFSFGSSNSSTKGAFGTASSTTSSAIGSNNLFFTSSPNTNSLSLASSSSVVNNPNIQGLISTNVATAVNASENIKPVQVSTSNIFGSQQSSFASLSKSASVTTINTPVSTSTPPKTSSGVASIFANLQSVIDKATGSSGATTTTVETSKSTLSFGIPSEAVTTTTQSLFGSVSSTSTSKPDFGATTFSSPGGLFGGIDKTEEPLTANMYDNSDTSAATISKLETLKTSSRTPNKFENINQPETKTESSLTTSATVNNKTPFGIILPVSTVATINKSNLSPTIHTTTQISVFNVKPTLSPSSTSVPLEVLTVTSPATTPSIFSSNVASIAPSSTMGTTSQPTSIFGKATPLTTSAASGTINIGIFGATTPTSIPSNNIFASDNSGSIFGNSAVVTAATVGKTFDSATTTSTSVFETSSTSKNIFGPPAASNIFAPPITSTASFPPTTSVSAFGTPNTSVNTFGTPTTSVTAFGTPTTSVTAFGTPTTPVTAFGTPTTSVTAFGTPATSVTAFGTPTTSVTAFGTPTTSSNMFGSSNSIFGGTAAAPTNNIFGAPSTTSANVFSTPTSTSATNIFGGAATSTAQNIFGSTANNAPAPFGSQGGSIFGTPKTTGNVFGQPNNFGNQATTASSIFGQPVSFGTGTSDFGSSTTTTSGNIFGNATSSSSEFGTGFGAAPITNTFGSQATTQAPTPGSFGFGTLNVGGTSSSAGSIFGSNSSSGFGATQTANPFGKVENKSPFGSGSTSIFGNSSSSPAATNIFASPATTASSIFGSSGGTTFGTSNAGGAFGSSSTFGSSAFGQKPTFGQTNTFGSNTFGSPQPGSFSGGGASPIAQSGFGSPPAFPKPSGFGSAPVFGGSPTPAFGAAPSFGGSPAFGGAPTFGSPEKVFGVAQTASSAFGAAGTQQTAGFGNLASQNTIGFGNLAQQASTPTSSPFSSGSSSFSSWR